MSGAIKSLGKAFKKVVKVGKKLALPALAIGAVALTGGGALPFIGKLGLSPALTGILNTAGKGALTGALGAAVTGGNVLKGATRGGLAGGVLGGVGALTGGIGPANAAARGAAPAFEAAIATAGADLPAVASGAARAGGGGFFGGIGSFINRNPSLIGNVLDGVGSGLIAAQGEKEIRRQEAQQRANYEGYSGSPNFQIGLPSPAQRAPLPSTGRPLFEFDATIGRLVPRGS